MELAASKNFITLNNIHGLVLRPWSNTSYSQYNCHCTKMTFPHKHKLVIGNGEYSLAFDECRCKPSKLTEDEWSAILRRRDENLRDLTMSMFDDPNTNMYTIINYPSVNVARTSSATVGLECNCNEGSMEFDTIAYPSKLLSNWKNDKKIISNCGSFLQTVATNSIINLNDWRLMDIIMDSRCHILLHGNDFLQISSTITIDRNRTLELLKKTQLSGRDFTLHPSGRPFARTQPLIEDYRGMLQIPISCANVIKNILDDVNVDIMSMRRYTFFDDWYYDCQSIQHPQHQHMYFANEAMEFLDMYNNAMAYHHV